MIFVLRAWKSIFALIADSQTAHGLRARHKINPSKHLADPDRSLYATLATHYHIPNEANDVTR